MLELERVLWQKKTNIGDDYTYIEVENERYKKEVVFEGLMIIFKDLKEILKSIDCKDVEIYLGEWNKYNLEQS